MWAKIIDHTSYVAEQEWNIQNKTQVLWYKNDDIFLIVSKIKV